MSDFCPENRLSDNAKKLEIDYESKATITERLWLWLTAAFKGVNSNT